MKATLVRRLEDRTTEKVLWELSEPIPYGWSDHKEVTNFVVTSFSTLYGNYETYAFPANSSGEIIDWGELPGSMKGTNDHQFVIDRLVDSEES